MEKKHRYYCPMRPPAPGSIPRDGMVDVHYLDDHPIVPEIGRRAWGWVDYDRALTPREINNYELIEAPVKGDE